MTVHEHRTFLLGQGFTEGQLLRFQRWRPTPTGSGDALQQVILYSGYADDNPQWKACMLNWDSPVFDSPIGAYTYAELENWGQP
jgi:hypothetical protein